LATKQALRGRALCSALFENTVWLSAAGEVPAACFCPHARARALLLTPATDITLERAVQLIKGGYSRGFGLQFGRKEIWQRGFTDHRIRNGEDFEKHRDYIHQNPVERGLVKSASEYRYCSAFPGFKLDEQTSVAEAERPLAS